EPVYYNWKKYKHEIDGTKIEFDEVDSTREVGIIAQDVFKVVPEVVGKPADEAKQTWSMSYDKVVPVLEAAIKEQQAEIEQLKAENAQTKEDFEELKQKVDSLLSAGE